MKLIPLSNKIIAFSFYTLLLLVPWTFNGSTSELFEFNKMWLTFGITTIIGFTWILKMTAEKKISIQRTPFDIPILLFLLSQIIATIFSLDQHVSWWGYYSRFNGGLLSTICYTLLYYALVTNLTREQVIRSIGVTLISAVGVILWGLPSRFGYDPTCFVFRGTLDTNCWTDAFKPTVRVFSTLGQPAWFAAYLAALLPVMMAFAIRKTQNMQQSGGSDHLKSKHTDNLATKVFRVLLRREILFFLLAISAYVSLIFANTRAGFIGFWIANIAFWTLIIGNNLSFLKKILSLVLLLLNSVLISFFFFKEQYLLFWLVSIAGYFLLRFFFFSKEFTKPLLVFHVCFFSLTFLFFPYQSGLAGLLPQREQVSQQQISPEQAQPVQQQQESLDSISGANITDSGKIRLLVWQGAVNAWKSSPLFGTGVETFAFAYYKFKPAEHNMTSEWDYLYNKAHNEYLNYLATTGLFGLGSYLLLIGYFLVISITNFLRTQKVQYANAADNQKPGQADGDGTQSFLRILGIGLVSGYISFLVSNFFGFSVVIINLFFFFFPAWFLLLSGRLKTTKNVVFVFGKEPTKRLEAFNLYQWITTVIAISFAGWFLLGLFRYWYADIAYALGSNLNKAGSPQEAYPQLIQAVETQDKEPVYTDELSIVMGTFAAGLSLQEKTADAQTVTQEAIRLSDQVISHHPNNVVYWKNRVRLFYTLAQGDPENQQMYLIKALEAIQKAYALAPNDAKILYNYAVLLGQTGNIEKGLEIMKQTTVIKPDYRDAYFGLGLFYRDLAVDDNDVVIDPTMNQKAIEAYEYILEKINPNDKEVIKSIESWRE